MARVCPSAVTMAPVPPEGVAVGRDTGVGPGVIMMTAWFEPPPEQAQSARRHIRMRASSSSAFLGVKVI